MSEKESQIQTAIECYLRLLENQKKIIYQKNNSGAYSIKGSFIRYGKKGSPDFYVFLNNGRILHLEVKTKTGKQNENQIEFQKNIEKLGHIYEIVRAVDGVQVLLNRLM